MGLEHLLEFCDKATNEYRWKLFWWSFFRSPAYFYRFVYENFYKEIQSDAEIRYFVKICDNRMLLLQSNMSDLSVMLGAIFVSFTVIATIFAITKSFSLGSLGITTQNPILTNYRDFPIFCTVVSYYGHGLSQNKIVRMVFI